MKSKLHIFVLTFLAFTWPISLILPRDIGIAVENTPAFGWIIDFTSDTDFSGISVGLYEQHFHAYLHGYALNPKPPLPLPYLSWFGADESCWLGSLRHGVGIGKFLRGSLFSRYWTSCTGVMFPLWPLSVLSTILLIPKLRRRIHQHRASQVGLCPTCSYDLRAHSPNSNCPECGMPVPSPPS